MLRAGSLPPVQPARVIPGQPGEAPAGGGLIEPFARPFHDHRPAAFGFAIAADVIAAIASALTGRRTQAPAAPEPLGYELAAEGGLEPSELVITDAQEDVPNRPTSRAKRTRTAVSLPGFPDLPAGPAAASQTLWSG